MDKNSIEYKKLYDAYHVILEHLRANTNDVVEKANFVGSEDRCVRALLETCKSEACVKEELSHIIDRVFPAQQPNHTNALAMGNSGIICQGPIAVNSCCPHHLYPVRYQVYVAYIPKDGKVLGLSKLARLSKILGRRPILHEQLASEIADVLCAPMQDVGSMDGELSRLPFKFPALESKGSAVLVVGTHTCMACRGVEENANTSVCELRGEFLNEGMEQKFYSLIKSIRTGAPF